MKRLIGVRRDGTEVKIQQGFVVSVPSLPLCDFCRMNEENVKAEYDFATRMGPWANGCERHWQMHRASHVLGVGLGQMLIEAATIREVTTPV